MIGDSAKATAFVAVLLLLGAYLALYRPAESAIAERYAMLDRETARLQERLVFARSAPALERERIRLRAELSGYRLGEDRARLVRRFLIAATDVARRRDLRILEITSTSAQPGRRSTAPVPTASPTAASATPLFDEVPLNLTVRGTYGGLIRAARDLCTTSIAVRLSIDSLVVSDRRRHQQPQLTATLHVTLLRDIDDQPIRARPV